MSAARGLRRLTRIAAAACLAIALAACLDGPTGPLVLGELRLRPTFAPGEDPAAFGLTIDSMRVVALRRSPAGAAVDTVMQFSSGATLSWLLDLAADPETFDVDVKLYGGPDTLYAGSASPAVALGFADGRAANDVALAYVGPPPASPIAQIVVKPSRVTLASLGATWQFDAEARDASGVPIPGVSFAWSSSATTVATIGQGTGLATALAEGTTSITAAAGGVAGTAVLDVDLSAASSVTSIIVTPASATLTAVGATQQFSALAFDLGGAPIAGVTFSWASTNGAVATVDAATGLATAVGEGSATISAAVGGVTGSASLAVDLGGGAPAVSSIVVTPSAATLAALGATQQYTAQAFDANGAPIDGVAFAWSSSNGSVASVDAATGLATATGMGTTTVTATAGTVTGTATLTVDLTSSVFSIVVTPAAATLSSLGATQLFTAEARDAAGQPLPGVPFTWASSTPAVAAVDATTGMATAIANGSTLISATAGNASGSATLQVTQAIAAIAVAPSSALLTALGASQPFTAVAFDAGGSAIAGVVFAWTSGTPAVASIDATSGVATAAGEGSTTISATAAGVTGTAVLDVVQQVAKIMVAPDTARVEVIGQSAQFTAMALDANGNPVAGASFVWSSSSPVIASIDPSTGVATTRDAGTVTITATGQGRAAGLTGTAVLLVKR